MMFSPVIVPFHVSEDGTPTSQLRVLFYRAKQTPDDKRLPVSTIVVHCEPFGTFLEVDLKRKPPPKLRP